MAVLQGEEGEQSLRDEALVNGKSAKYNLVNKSKFTRRQCEALLKSQMAFFMKTLENYRVYKAKLQCCEKKKISIVKKIVNQWHGENLAGKRAEWKSHKICKKYHLFPL